MKSTIQKYGWIVVTVLILAVLIGIAGPAANYIKNNFAGVTDGFGDIMESGQDYTLPYTVKLKTNIEGAGTVEFTGEHSGTKVDLRGNQTLTFKATVNNGFRFLGWYVGSTLLSEDLEYTAGYDVNDSVTITAKFEAYLAPGLYDVDNNLVASWDTLVKTYKIDVTTDYSSITCNSSPYSPYCVLTNNTELSAGVKLVIPDDVTKIGNFVFRNCTSLTNIEIPNSVISIGQRTFEGCINLTSITFGENSQLTSIGYSAFSDCTNLKMVYYGGTVEQWCQINFNSSPCRYGANLYIDGELATNITIPNTITTINNYTFRGCTSLTSIEIPDSVTSIGNMAFYECIGLTSVKIGDSVTNIGSEAFRGCSKLKTLTIEAIIPPTFGTSAFYKCSLTTIYVPAESVEAYKAASGWKNYAAKIQPIPTT